MSIVVVIPSRGRPKNARYIIESLRATAALVDTSIVLAVDYDDPVLPRYQTLTFASHGPDVATVVLHGDETGNLTRATNTPALRIADDDPTAIIGTLNDDMIARTKGWDRLIRDALTSSGIAYGDDLFQHARLVTSPFITADIVLALGWYALPSLQHQFIDNVWRDIGHGLDRLTYIPHLVFEHLHPFAGKGEWDATYEHGNAQSVIDHDAAAYYAWRETQMELDLERVRKALAVAA